MVGIHERTLLTRFAFRPNYSSPYAPEAKENVTFTSYHNIYVYDSRTLWTAYGLAIGFTTLSVTIGMVALSLNNAAYTNDFSTVLRVSRSTDLVEEIYDNEWDGSRPLPKHLAKARALIRRSEEKQSPRLDMGKSSSVFSSITFLDEPQATASSSLLRADSRRTV